MIPLDPFLAGPRSNYMRSARRLANIIREKFQVVWLDFDKMRYCHFSHALSAGRPERQT